MQHASEITKQEENTLLKKGVMSDATPEQLLNAAFYYNGKKLYLCGGKEHCALKINSL